MITLTSVDFCDDTMFGRAPTPEPSFMWLEGTWESTRKPNVNTSHNLGTCRQPKGVSVFGRFLINAWIEEKNAPYHGTWRSTGKVAVSYGPEGWLARTAHIRDDKEGT